MESLKIELKNKNALSILKSLEKAQMIKLMPKEHPTKRSTLLLQDTLLKKGSGEANHAIEQQTTTSLRKYGFAKDAIILNPDFDKPMDDFKEYL